jgi:rhomboid protease GluP
MAFGFPSSYSQYLALNRFSKSQFIFIAIEVVKQLNWKIIEINETEILVESQNTNNTWNEYIIINVENENALIKSWSRGKQIYDRGRNKKNFDSFLELFYAFIKEKEVLDENESLFKEYISNEKTAIQSNSEEEKITTFYSFFSIFIPTNDYYITPILININILYFLIMCFSGVNPFLPEINDIIDWGGNYGPLTIENNWWRLLSSCFVHIGIFHLLMNCLALAYIGLLIESNLKKGTFLLTYLFAGIFASLCSLFWNDNLVSAGASGAIFGMYGVLLPLLLFGKIDKKLNPNLLSSTVVFIIVNLMSGFQEGIDGAAHIGGLCFGIVSGSIIVLLASKRKTALVIVSTFAVILCAILINICKDNKVFLYQTLEYETGMKDFSEMEKLALEAYHEQSDTKEHILYMIKDRGIYYWEECITTLKDLERLSLPEALHNQNKNLIKYCELRIKSYDLSYKKINENSIAYDSAIENLNDQISELMLIIKNNYEKQSKNH